jgi:hypothetical protein
MCKFKGIILEDNRTNECFETILIDDYYVNCVNASDVKCVVVEMIDGNHDNNNPKIIEIPIRKSTASVHFPMP